MSSPWNYKSKDDSDDDEENLKKSDIDAFHSTYDVSAVEQDEDDSPAKKPAAAAATTQDETSQHHNKWTCSFPKCKFSFSSLCDTKAKRYAWCFLLLAIVATGIALLATSLKKVQSTEYGLQYNIHAKVLDNATKTGGLHAGPPGFRFVKFPSTFVTVNLPDGTCVSKDGIRVEFQVTFQYQMPREWVRPVVLKYRDFDKWATVVEAAGNSAVQHTCSEFFTSNFQNQRGVIQNTMEQNLRLKLEGEHQDGASGVYARAISLQLRNVALPGEYKDAVANKQAAAEDIELAKNQRTQERTKAETQLLAAQEEARRILDTAENEANVTLTEAQLKVEETTFAFETEAKVLTRVKKHLNLTTEGVLAHMANRLYADVENLKVSTGEPAKMSRKDEL